MTTDFKQVKMFKPKPKMVDPLKFPGVQQPLEQQMKDSYEVSLNKMFVDLTKKFVELHK